MTTQTRVALSRKLALLVPLVLVNAVAVWGQAGWAYNHITEPTWPPELRWLLSFGFAAAVESIGVYLAWEAHSALMANQSSGLLRAGSYAVGLLAGFLNYAHFAGDTYTPTPQAITFGLLSAISPWLWAIRSRSMNRDRLAELDMIDERGLKLSTSRKFWHPVKSLRVIRWAAWAGVTKPMTAVAGWEATRMTKTGRTAAPVAATLTPDTEPVAPAVSAIESVTAEMPVVPAGGDPSGVPLNDREAKETAQALRFTFPDMPEATIAQRIGRSERQTRRYLSGMHATVNGKRVAITSGADAN